MIKRVFAFIISVFMLISVLSVPSLAAESSYKTRDDFDWGITIHNSAYEAYAQDPELYISKSAELGVELIRVNTSVYNDDFSYLDKVVELCSRYRLKIILLLPLDDNLDLNTETYKKVASRYNGKNGHGFIDYIEIGGEEEVPLLLKKYPVNGPDGSSVDHYYESDLITLQAKYQSAIDGINAADSAVQTVIDFSHLHYAPLLYMYNRGLSFDVIGIDWYTNMGSIRTVLSPVISKFPHDIIITETNLWSSETTNHENISEWNMLFDFMDYSYSSSRVKGLCFYELMDEPAFERNGGFTQEAHFGFLYTNTDGSVKGEKPIYSAVKQMLGGGTVTPEPTLPKDSICVLDLDGSHTTFADTPNWLFYYISDRHQKENAGIADFSNAESISFDMKIGDFDSFKSAIEHHGINLWFRVTSSSSRNFNAASAQILFDDFIPLENNWYRVTLPISAFNRIENGNIDWSAIKSWMFFPEGNTAQSVGSLYSMEFCFRNICATRKPPAIKENAVGVLDAEGKTATLGTNFHHLCDRLNVITSSVDLHNADYIEFDLKVSDRAAIDALTDKKLHLSLTSGSALWQSRSVAALGNLYTTVSNGWYHYKIPKKNFVYAGNGYINWYSVNTWFLTFEGANVTDSTGALEGVSISLINLCGTTYSLKSDYYTADGGYLLLNSTLSPKTLASRYYANASVTSSGNNVCSGDKVVLISDSAVCDSITVVIKNDIVPNGYTDSDDLVLMRKFLLGHSLPDDIQLRALSLKSASALNIKNLIQIKKAL